MNADETIDLLAIVQAGDNRTVGETDVVLWGQVLAGLDPDDCAEAIIAHRRDRPGVWLEPGHVAAGAKAIRRDRYERSSTDDPMRTAQERLWNAKATGELEQADETPYARGLHLEFDPAGWGYGTAGSREERAAAAAELDARIDAYVHALPLGEQRPSPGDAEVVLRIGDRVRAEEFLRASGRAHLVDMQLGVQPPKYAEMTRKILSQRRVRDSFAAAGGDPADDLPNMAFSEPLHLPGGAE